MSIRQHAFEVEHRGQTIRGTVYQPDTDARRPTVLMLHGFTGQRMETGFLFVHLARALAAHGIAAVTFDFLGSGESDGSFEQTLVSGEVADALRVTDWLVGQPFVDRARLGLLGFSLGGLVAACVVGRTKVFRALTLLAPTTVQNLCRHAGQPDCKPLDTITRGALTLHERFFDDLRTLDPLSDCAKNPRPTLIVQGTGDTAVPPEVSRLYAHALRGAGAPVDVHLVQGADHGFSSSSWRSELSGRVTAWLAQRLSV